MPTGRHPRYPRHISETWRALHRAGMSLRELARLTRVNRCVVTRHVRGEIRHHDPEWMARKRA